MLNKCTYEWLEQFVFGKKIQLKIYQKVVSVLLNIYENKIVSFSVLMKFSKLLYSV